MENASKALLIAGAILLCILIIAIGMYIYNSAQSTITDSLMNLSTQEIESFNNQFMVYQGLQKGTNIQNLKMKLIANASTYADEPTKLPNVILCDGLPHNGHTPICVGGSTLDKYIDLINSNLGFKKKNREYYVCFSYQKNGLINSVYVYGTWGLNEKNLDLYSKCMSCEDSDPVKR